MSWRRTEIGDSILIQFFGTVTNVSPNATDVCGELSIPAYRYRPSFDTRCKTVRFGVRNTDYKGPSWSWVNWDVRKPEIQCDVTTLQPNESIVDTMEFYYKNGSYAGWPGDLRFRCVFCSGLEDRHWALVDSVDVGVVRVKVP
jgi:hypothetical protein